MKKIIITAVAILTLIGCSPEDKIENNTEEAVDLSGNWVLLNTKEYNDNGEFLNEWDYDICDGRIWYIQPNSDTEGIVSSSNIIDCDFEFRQDFPYNIEGNKFNYLQWITPVEQEWKVMIFTLKDNIWETERVWENEIGVKYKYKHTWARIQMPI